MTINFTITREQMYAALASVFAVAVVAFTVLAPTI